MITVRRRLVVLPALVLAGGLLLTACGDDKTVSVDGTDYKVSQDGDDVKIESSEGSFQASSGSLPDGFPTDEVPVADGKIEGAYGTETENRRGYTLAITIDGDLSAAYESALSELKAAGFKVTSTTELDGIRMATLATDDWGVTISAQTEDNQILYIVSEESDDDTHPGSVEE